MPPVARPDGSGWPAPSGRRPCCFLAACDCVLVLGLLESRFLFWSYVVYPPSFNSNRTKISFTNRSENKWETAAQLLLQHGHLLRRQRHHVILKRSSDREEDATGAKEEQKAAHHKISHRPQRVWL